MQAQRDGIENVERLRVVLESNIQQLRKSLTYWQLWAAEYEGLKETLSTLSDGASGDDMLAAGVDMGGDMVDEKEIKRLIWPAKGTARSKPQVISNINGRIDTGEKNEATVRKQLHTAEDKLEQVLFISRPTASTEEGLPVMAITEELDDEDNIISSSVKREDESLGADMDKYMAALGKATPSIIAHSVNAPAPAKQPSIRKRVSFATEPEVNMMPPREANISTFSPTKPARAANIHPTEHMIILDDNDNAIGSEPLEVVNTAKLALEARQNMNGIGAIVASMTIDALTDDEDDDYDDGDSEELDDVDWRTLDRAPVGADLADDSYRSYIQGLMKKHEAAFENVGPRHDESILESLASSEPVAAMNKSNLASISDRNQGTGTSRQKGVRFAEELDIQASPASSQTPNASAMSQPSAAPISENILERGTSKKPLVNSVIERTNGSRKPTNAASEPAQPKKVSRFKAARSEG